MTDINFQNFGMLVFDLILIIELIEWQSDFAEEVVELNVYCA